MSVDLTSIAEVLLSLAAAGVTAAIPIVVPFVLGRFKVANNADLTGKLELALNAAAGAAYKFAASHEGGLSNVAVHNGALATAASYVATSMPDTLKQLGITPDRVSAMVSARLGTLLATDPSVTVGKPPAETAPVVVAPAVPAAPVPMAPAAV